MQATVVFIDCGTCDEMSGRDLDHRWILLAGGGGGVAYGIVLVIDATARLARSRGVAPMLLIARIVQRRDGCEQHLRVWVHWPVEYGDGRSTLDDAALAQDDGVVADVAAERQVVGHEEHTEAAGFQVSWCNSYNGHGPTIGLGWTTDFNEFTQLDNAFLPFNRNGVLFPRRIGGAYIMLSRPSDNGHTPFGDIYCSESPDLVHWGRHRHVMAPLPWTWQSTKVGAGPTPIETDEGWLLLYHGVLTSCNGFVYSMGVALLDLDEPWKVIERAPATTSTHRRRRTSKSAMSRTSFFHVLP